MNIRNKIYFSGIALLFILTGCSDRSGIIPVRKDIVDAVFASGNIETKNHYLITSQLEGYLVKSFIEEGDSVKKGETLFHIYDDTQKAQLESSVAAFEYAKNNTNPDSEILRQLNAQKEQARNKFVNDSVDFQRYSSLIKSKAVSQVEYERANLNYENSKQALISVSNQLMDTRKNLDLELFKAKANLIAQQNSYSYYKPVCESDGIVLQVSKEKGELVKKGETIAEIGSGDFIAKLFVSEEDINLIKTRQEVFIELNTEKNRSHKAKVIRIFPAFDNQEQSFLVEAGFTDSTVQLKSGTQLQANIVVGKKHNALVIPTEYLFQGDYVYVKSKKTKIITGIKTPEWTEIISGIDENTTIQSKN